MKKSFYNLFIAASKRFIKKVPRSYFLVAIVLILAASFDALLFLRPELRPETDSDRSRKGYERLLRPLRTMDDEAFAYDELKGKVVLLNFWAGWCVFCVREMPALEKLSREYKERGFVVIGIHRTDTESVMVGKEYAKKQGVTYLLLKDERGDAYRYFSVAWTMPTSIIIDRLGFVSEVVLGERSEAQWRALIEPYLVQGQ